MTTGRKPKRPLDAGGSIIEKNNPWPKRNCKKFSIKVPNTNDEAEFLNIYGKFTWCIEHKQPVQVCYEEREAKS